MVEFCLKVLICVWGLCHDPMQTDLSDSNQEFLDFSQVSD